MNNLNLSIIYLSNDEGGEQVAQAEDARESATQDGQNRHRLSEAARRLLQVADEAENVVTR